MTANYNTVVGLLPTLDDIRYNLTKQHINLQQWATLLPLEPLIAFHRSYIDEAQLAQDRNHDLLLALIGTALAVPGVFDRVAAAMLLACFDPATTNCLFLGESAAETLNYSIFTLLVVQLIVVLLVTWLVFCVLKWIRRR